MGAVFHEVPVFHPEICIIRKVVPDIHPSACDIGTPSPMKRQASSIIPPSGCDITRDSRMMETAGCIIRDERGMMLPVSPMSHPAGEMCRQPSFVLRERSFLMREGSGMCHEHSCVSHEPLPGGPLTFFVCRERSPETRKRSGIMQKLG